GKNVTQTTSGTATSESSFISLPDSSSRENNTRLPECWFDAIRNFSLGSSVKSRGLSPPVGLCSTSVSSLFFSSILYNVILLCPRFPVYRNFPSDQTYIALASFVSLKSSGMALIVCLGVNSPFASL